MVPGAVKVDDCIFGMAGGPVLVCAVMSDEPSLGPGSAPVTVPLRVRARRVAPFVIAAVAMAWVLRSVLGLPPQPDKVQALVEVFRHVPYGRFLAASVALLWLNCAADSLAMFYTFRWFGCRLPYRELFIIRASTYLLAVVQYYVGQAAILAFLHRRRGVPFVVATGWILFISGINMGVLVLLAAVGLVGSDGAVPWLRAVPLAVGAGALVYGAILWRRPRQIADFRLLAPLFAAGVVGHLKATGVRLPHVLVLILWHYLSLRWFGVNVPFFTALVLLPAVFFAAALPISVQGLGLSQAAAVYFFSAYAPAGKTAVLAYSLAMTTVSLISQIGMGLLFLPAGRRLGLESPPDDAAGQPAGEAAPDRAEAGSRGAAVGLVDG